MASAFADALDVDALIASLDERVPRYLTAVATRVDSAIRNSTTANLLQITVYRLISNKWEPVRVERPPFNSDWVELFIKYLRGKTGGNDRKLEAGIEAVITEACMEASKDYFNSPETFSVMASGLAAKLDTNSELQSILGNELKSSGKFVKKEAKDMIAAHGHLIMADRAHDVLAHAIAGAMHGVVGTVLLKALMLPSVKLAIMKAITIALGSAAIQHLLVAIAKKVGITVLLVIIFGHASGAVIGLIAAPIIAVLLIHQYETLPETLAKKMVPKLMEEVERQAPQVNRTVGETFVEVAKRELLKMGDKALGKLHDEAMKELSSQVQNTASMSSGAYWY